MTISILSSDKQALLRQRLLGRAASGKQGIPRRPEGRATLSPAQQSMWVANQFLESNAIYGVPRVLRLAAPVEVETLRRALAALVARHEILRTSYPDPAEPHQQVHPPAPVPLRVVDVPAEQAMAVVREEMDTPFDLARGPVFRALLVGDLLVLNTHHIATDDWSATLMLRELDELYGGASTSAPLPVQYADYAHWQNQRLADKRDQQLAYWRTALAGTPRMLELPTDRPRPATPSFAGDTVTCSISPELSARARELAAAQGVTASTLLLAAFAEVLRHASGQERFAVGTPLSGRNVAESEPLVGLFMNTVALPLDLSGEPTFRALLQRTHEAMLGGLDHQDVTFEQVVQALGADRTPPHNSSHNPVYQIIYQCLEAGERVHELPALRAEPVRLRAWSAKVDLTLDAVNGPVTIDLALNFATDLFDRTTAERLLRRHLVNVVRHVVDHPDHAVDSAAVMGAGELTTVIRDWNATATSYPADCCVHELFEQQVALAPAAVAVSTGETTVSYGELNRRANQVAHYLRRSGVGPDSLVGVCLAHSVELFAAILGVLKAGGAYVPLDPENPPERLGFIVEDADAAVVLANGRTAEALPASCRDRLVDLDREASAIRSCPESDLAPSATADSLVYVIYTSGSTGRPKGVMLSHGSVVNYLAWAASSYGPEAAHGAPLLGSVAYDLAVTNFLVPLTSGKDVRLLADEAPLEALAALLREGADFSLLKATPGHLAVLGEALGPGSVEGVRTFVVGGDELRASAVQSWRVVAPGARMINEYGPTETVVGCCVYDVPAGADQVPIGKPIANTQLYVLDDRLQPVPVGAVGELCIGGAGVARGYLNRPGLTAERFLPDPFSPTPGARFYRTGDLARYRADGNLEFLGRNDDQVKVRGYRVEPGEIEARLLGHPSVAEAVVSLVDEQLVAHVVSEVAPRDLRDHLRRELPDHMVPDHVVLLDALPLSTGGKIDRKALPAPDAHRPDLDAGFVAPRTPIEEAIAGVWCDVLGLASVGVHDDFFELGGHSLLVIRAVARLREALGAELSMRSIFDHRTIAALAAAVHPAASEAIPARGDGGPAPLSLSQARLWFLHTLEPDDPVYNVVEAFPWDGPLRVDVLWRAVGELVARHEVLRTRFLAPGGDMLPAGRSVTAVDMLPAGRSVTAVAQQVVDPPARVPLEIHDLSGEPERVDELVRSLGERTIDLANGPVFFVDLVRLAPAEHVVVLTTHHIVSDAWSVAVLRSELTSLYEGAALPPLPVQYGDYARWQRERLAGDALADQLDFWREHLSGAGVLELPTDRPRPAVQTSRGDSVRFELPPEVVARVQELSRAHDATPFMVLLAVYEILLSRWSGQPDFTVGIPVANRQRPELEHVVGLFVNTLPLRVDCGGDPSFADLLAATRAVALAVYAHQEVPFERIVDELQPRRDLSRTPLFTTTFDLYRAPPSVRPAGGTSAKFDLSLQLREDGDALAGGIVFNTDLFDAPSIARLATHFQNLLAAALASPETPVSQLALLGDEERRAVLHGWAEHPMDQVPADCPHELFEAQVDRAGDAVAVVDGDESLTYAELDAWATRLAWRLRSVGVGPEVLVGIAVERGVAMVAGLLAIAKAGGAYVPLDPGYPRERLEFMLADSGVAVLVTQTSLAGRLPAAGIATVCVDEDVSAGPTERIRDSGVVPDNAACVFYTSGSTGRPKGTVVTGRAIVARMAEPTFVELTGDDVVGQVSTLSFDAATFEIWATLLAGARLAVIPGDALVGLPLRDALRANHVSVLFSTTAVFNDMVRQDLTAYSSVRCVLFGGESANKETVRSLLASPDRPTVKHVYGPTETTTFASCGELALAQVEGRDAVPIGGPIGATGLYVLDAWGGPVPVGVAGELFIGGPGVARGYLGRPGLTAARFVPDPFGEPGARLYRTGDSVRWLPDGTIEFLGRFDDQVKVRGFRVEPGEIEARLQSHPGVAQVMVMAREDTPGVKRLVAYVVPAAAGRAPSTSELRTHLRDVLPDYMVPAAFVPLEALPLNPNGKVDRKALPAPSSARPDVAVGYVAPRSVTEGVLAAIWAEVLGVDDVGVHDDFFELGGDSILSIQVMAAARRAGLTVTPRQVFGNPSIAELAALVDAGGPPAAVEAAQGPVTGAVPLTPIQRWFVSLDCPRDHHNQSVRLRWNEPVDVEALHRALAAVAAHHDALRLRLQGDAQHIVAEETAELLWLRDGDAAPAADEAHTSLDLAAGPVLRAVLVRDELILVVHHMAVDVVSWNILLEDLATAYRQGALPAKTTSYQQWAHRLVDYAADDEFVAPSPPPAPTPFPLDREGPNTYGSTATVTTRLGAAATETLRRGAHGAYRTRITDLLVAALAQTLAGHTGEPTVQVTLEGHGREPLFDDVDLSRTVGWFTSLWPLAVEIPDPDDPGRAITAVKEAIHSTPHNGIGYGIADRRPTAPVSFNYLGQASTTGSGGLFGRLAPLGADTPPTGARPHVIDITAAITGGELEVRWTYSTNLHDEPTITALAEGYVDRLGRLLDLTASGAGGVTPSDFPLAGLDQAALDRILDGFEARQIEDVYPVSPLQAGMVFHSLFEPDGSDYFVHFVYALEPGFDAAALRRAWDHVLARHPILRTTFAWEGVPQPVQIVHRRWSANWRELDWQAAPTDRLAAHLAAERERGFDLRQAPPHRFDLIRLADGTGRLVWHNHHILLDAWSEQLVLEEVRVAYHAFRDRGVAPDLPEPVPYRRYVDWLQGHDPADAALRWQRMLADVALPTPVAVLEHPPDGDDGDVASLVVEVPVEVTERLQQVARQHRITVGSVVHAAWGLLLSRYGGGPDVVFGSTVAGRSGGWPGVERAVGLLINTLPVRVHVPADATVADWLRHVHEQLVEVRDLEHSSLVDVQRQGHVAAGQRLFDTILMFENLPHAPRRDDGGLSVTPSLSPDRTGYPLVLNAHMHERMLVRLDYQPARVAPEAAQRLVEHYRMLLDLLTAAPDRRLGDLASLPPEERDLVVAAFNDTAAPVPAGRCLHELFEAQVDATPTATAVIAEGETLSYEALEARANRLARYLIDLGVAPETSVGICVERGVDLVVAVLAVLKAGGAYLPLDPDYPAERLAFMVQDTAAPVVLTQGRLVDRLPQAAGRLVCLDAEDEASRIARYDASRPASGVTPDNLAYTIYTSGSTGRPKGTLIRHGGIVNYVWWMTDTFPLGAGDTVLQLAGVSFDISVWEMFWPWSRGAAVVLARPDGYKDPQYIAEVMEREAITSAHLVPSMLRALLPLAAGRSLALRWLFASAESLPLDVLAAWEKASPDTTFVNMYGATEVSVDSTAWWCDSSAGRVLVGRPIANQRVHVLDQRGDPSPIGVPGEAYLGGASVGRGYLGRPGLTARRFVPDPFGAPGARLYRTGDLVRWLPDGNLEFLGRLDHQVKIRGFRVELGEVEARLSAHPGLDRAVVVAREDQPGQKRLVAYVVARGADSPTTSELRAHVRAVLPDYMVPAAFVVLEALPLNPNGKTDRAALPAPSGVRPDLEAGFVAPRSATEAVLADVWGEVLGVDRVGVHDDFFELGGDSILSIQVMAAARRAGLTVTPRQVFDHPSVAGLAAAIDSDGAVVVEAEQGTVSGAVPLTPIQRWFVSGDCPGNRYNQSVRLRWHEPVDPSALRSALAELVAHHDALRLRLHGDVQHVAAVEDHELLWVGRTVDEVHGSLDLAAGPVVRALLVEPDETILVAHHLAVDVVSWNILVEDLETAYRQNALPPKTTSYQQWAQRLVDHAAGDEFAAEAAWWRARRPAPMAFPVDHDRGPNTYGSTATVTTTLDVGAHRTRIGDVLVAALARTLAARTGESTVQIDLEGHGREPLFDDVDLSRTVGWFTSLWPLTVELPDPADPGRVLTTVREHLRGTPHNGIGYGIADPPGWPTPPVSFNYLGQSVSSDSAGSLFSRLPTIGSHTRASAARPHLVDVTAAISDGRLDVHWTYSTNIHDHTTIAALADSFVDNLADVLDHGVRSASSRVVDRMFPGAPTLPLALQRHHVPGVGVAVLADGDVVDTWGEGDAASGIPVRPDTVFQVGSISKHVTAVGVLHLASEGRLDLDADVNRYLQTWQLPPADPQRPVTLRHLLSHDAGVSVDQFASFGGYAPDGPVPSILAMLLGQPPAVTDPVRCEHPAGGRFRYSGNNYVVVEQILTDVTGQPFPELMRELVFAPLGMHDSGYGPAFVRRRGDGVAAGHDRDGRVVDGGWRLLPSATGGLWASAADLGRVAAELWRASRGHGVLLDQRAADELLSPIRPGVAYGLGTVVRTVDGVRWVGHTGDALGYQCHTALALDTGLGLVVATNGDAGMELIVDVLVELGLGLHVWTAREE